MTHMKPLNRHPPAERRLSLPRLLSGEVAFPQDADGQIGFLVVVPVIAFEVSGAVSPAPAASFGFQLVAQQVSVLRLLPRLLTEHIDVFDLVIFVCVPWKKNHPPCSGDSCP